MASKSSMTSRSAMSEVLSTLSNRQDLRNELPRVKKT